MGCGETLFLSVDGIVTCSLLSCEQPEAVSALLEDRETDHIIWLGGEDSYTVRHPLRERLDDGLLNCPLDSYLISLDGPPTSPGCYLVALERGEWAWHLIDVEERHGS